MSDPITENQLVNDFNYRMSQLMHNEYNAVMSIKADCYPHGDEEGYCDCFSRIFEWGDNMPMACGKWSEIMKFPDEKLLSNDQMLYWIDREY